MRCNFTLKYIQVMYARMLNVVHSCLLAIFGRYANYYGGSKLAKILFFADKSVPFVLSLDSVRPSTGCTLKSLDKSDLGHSMQVYLYFCLSVCSVADQLRCTLDSR